MERYDITIIGGGSAGLTAARLAAALGANVLLVDKQSLGGDCLHYGCVPSKALIHVAHVVHQAKVAAKLELVPSEFGVDMARVSAYVQDVIRRVAETESVYTEGVTVKFGKIAFKTATELELNGKRLISRNTIIATGSRPAAPAIEGLAETGYLTNQDVFDLAHLPASIVVVGGGPVGAELGQAFERLGAKITIIQGPARLLPREEPEVSQAIANALQAEGIEVITGARFIRAARQGEKKLAIAEQSGRLLKFEADEILLAVGRQPNVDGLNLEAAGIEYDQERGIKVNDYLQTTAPHVLAIGDVIDGYRFSHVAAYQAGVAVRNALLPLVKKKVDYRVVPWCTFTDPEAAHVGLTSEQAGKQYSRVRLVTFPWAAIDRAQTDGDTAGFIKLVLAGKKEKIVGAHLVGAHAGELLGELSLAMRHHLHLSDILNTIHAYPTMSTGLQQTAFEAYLQGSIVTRDRRIVRAILRLRR
jgi:pyruvate/2-oxoglutarate dehydrogenase complex dihydrolipoamide dehydrogenase (E3) component